MTPTRKYRRAAAFVAVAASAGLALPATAGATVTPVLDGTTLTVTSDADPDNITIAAAGGFLTVNGAATAAPSNDTIDLVVNGGDGNDNITINLAVDQAKSITADGGSGNDILTGSDADADALRGGDGNDRIVGRSNPDAIFDDMEGGLGNDVLVWNPGDDSDVMDGDGGADDIELNGGNAGEDFVAASIGDRVRFERLATRGNGAFALDGGTVERLVLNGNGGDDTMDGDPGLTVATLLNGGVGADTLIGGAAADFINGGDDNDILTGNGGPDRIVGDRGADTMAGGDGDDTTVWNNGDGSDKMDGEAGLDRVEVNGATNGANNGDAFTIAPNGARAKFDRTNLGPFTLDIGSAEALDVRGQNGDDTLAGGAGPDLLDGQSDNDSLLARDNQGDVARGGAGTDSAQTDVAGVDIVDAVESVDALAAPPVVAPDTKATAARIAGGRKAVRIRNGRASTRLAISCPAAEAGGCVGTVALLTSKPVRIGGERVFVVLGNARYNLRAGQRRVITVQLGSARALRKIDRNRNIAVRAQTITRDAARNTATGSRSLTLRLPR
jgi:Ca2+-binding RTX toxin-like protein